MMYFPHIVVICNDTVIIFTRGVDPRLLAPSGSSSQQDNEESFDSASDSDASTVTERVRPHQPKSVATRGQYQSMLFRVEETESGVYLF